MTVYLLSAGRGAPGTATPHRSQIVMAGPDPAIQGDPRVRPGDDDFREMRATPERFVALDRHAVAVATLREIIPHRVVLDAAVVPERDRVRFPAEAGTLPRYAGSAF